MIFDIGDLLNLRPEMRAPPRLADVHTNSKILLETPNKIETIQRKLECSVQKGVGSSIDVVAGNMTTIGEEKQKKLKKLLLNVHIQNSLGPVHVVISHENAVGDLIKAAIEIYVKEKRRPLLPSRDSRCYELHYSQFSLESLKPGEKLLNLESRSFFLCPKPNCSINSSSKDKAKATAKFPLLLAKFMDLLV
ncbi:PREDICTED: uncharacterized protein LOC109244939 [Nicotiana attenuata]|uniref:DUF7054 domain-containing protein n=1 Tax=Nicotiana attenuata TaxID=49451 RepID=A0A314KY87_NICAT|nr:PREDICTED: uncharacterized protein LOC109244939 [Nicotiana attenuata]OIT34243.1 hypothetical protein A4A49_36494 [Nicotiana attenuata]